MSSYDLETRRLLCSERIEQLSRDARRPMSRGGDAGASGSR